MNERKLWTGPLAAPEAWAARVGASIGIAMYPAHSRTASDLLRDADAAMYAAKASGKNAYCFAHPATADRRQPV